MKKRPVAVIIALGVVFAGLWVTRTRTAEKTASTSETATATNLGGVVMDGNRAVTKVGFLPVTCHLTCPVTDFATRTSTSNKFESERFTDFPTVVETMKAGKMNATFMIVPLAMKIREQGIPVKIVYLGHRDGSTVMVQKSSTAKSLRDLKGKTFAIPSKFSNQYLVIRKLMEDQGMVESDLKFVEMAPPEMPSALAAKAIDGYFVGEPHAAKAELDGTGRVLYHAKDIWPHFISCCLVVTEKLVTEKPEIVRDLVRGIAESGEWAETHRLDAAKVASPYFRQNEKVLKFVLTQPVDRVSYRMLTPTDADLQKIYDMGVKTGVLKGNMAMADLIDRQFIPKGIKAATIDMADAGKSQ